MSIAVGVENVHQECPLSPSRVHRESTKSVHRVFIECPSRVCIKSIECPPSPSRVLRRARRFLLLQVTCASSVGLPGLRGGVRACGSFLIKLIAPKTETETRSVPTQGWRVISFRRETTADILSFIALQLDMTSDYIVEK